MANDAQDNKVSPQTLPVSERTANILALFGIACISCAALMNHLLNFPQGTPHELVDGSQTALSLLGMLIVGISITKRALLSKSWFYGLIGASIASFSFPDSFYSLRVLAHVCVLVTTVGTFLLILPFGWRIAIASALPIIHFFGILTAVLSPPPAPSMMQQLWAVVFRPYLQFAYLNNAYQFYSPDPGPATELWFCFEYETQITDPVQMMYLQRTATGEPVKDIKTGELVYLPLVDEYQNPKGNQLYNENGERIFESEKDRYGNPLMIPRVDDELSQPIFVKKFKWYKMPRRPRDVKDPLAQSYYRRLSLTENAATITLFSRLPLSLQEEIKRRRFTMTPEWNMVSKEKQIPLSASDGNFDVQYRLPGEMVSDVILPAYVRHVAREFGTYSDETGRPRAIVGIKVYRVLHTIIEPNVLIGDNDPEGKHFEPLSPYAPTTYLPFYMGDFDKEGNLRDPGDPMLYWLIPIRRRIDSDSREKDYSTQPSNIRDYNRLYEDFVTIHAGSNHKEDELKQSEHNK